MFLGDGKLTGSDEYLKYTMDQYHRALATFHVRMGVKTHQLVQSTSYPAMVANQGLAELKVNEVSDKISRENKFLVRYQENPRFIGRTQFLQSLRERLSERLPQKFNHRIALYGMGGIGKTQIALRYVYDNKAHYQRIYWLTAVSQGSLLAGYREISKAMELKSSPNSNALEIAELVLFSLNREESWLLVIDNLDDISVVENLLPVTGPQKHTLITTKNSNAAGIPAEGIEVPLLDDLEAVNLLSALSNITIEDGTPEWKQANRIVKKLGRLPLAIEQAAAYIREGPGDLMTFLNDYMTNQKELHTWVPSGNRQYLHSIATCWSMSFEILRKSNSRVVKLFQIMSLLNPDGILIDFLKDGLEALDYDLQTLVLNKLELAKGLMEMEKWSLIRRDRFANSIVIHRLVQAVVRDELDEKGLEDLCHTVIEICDRAFPKVWSTETRVTCRRYFDQVVEPLVTMVSIGTTNRADTMGRVGYSLRQSGRLADSKRLLAPLPAIYAASCGENHPDTLRSMVELALTYKAQGRIKDAGELEEQVLRKRKEILGEDHPDTVTSMANLVSTYQALGRIKDACNLEEAKRCCARGRRSWERIIQTHSRAWQTWH